MTAVPPWARALLRCPACHAELADAEAGAAAEVHRLRVGLPGA